MKSERSGGGVGQNVPLEIVMFMSVWIASLQQRKTVDISTVNALVAALNQLNDALSNLERILTTPIPFSFDAHIWGVTYLYCILLPFQLYGVGFGWLTIPAVIVGDISAKC
jgi:putative membrane protein